MKGCFKHQLVCEYEVSCLDVLYVFQQAMTSFACGFMYSRHTSIFCSGHVGVARITVGLFPFVLRAA